MEDIISDEAAFRSAFAVPDQATLAHFAGKTVHRLSHRSKDEAQVLAAPDREEIQEKYTLNLVGRDYRITDVALMLGY